MVNLYDDLTINLDDEMDDGGDGPEFVGDDDSDDDDDDGDDDGEEGL